MRDRVFKDHEEQLIDIYDVKVLFFFLLKLSFSYEAVMAIALGPYTHSLKLSWSLFELT